MCPPWYTPLCGICHLQYTEVRPVVYRSAPCGIPKCALWYGRCALVGMGNVLSLVWGTCSRHPAASDIPKLAKEVIATGATTPLSELGQRPFHHHDGSSRRPKTDRTPREPDERRLSTHQRHGHRHRRYQRHRRRRRHGQNQRHLTATATAAAAATAVAAAASTGGTRALACRRRGRRGRAGRSRARHRCCIAGSRHRRVECTAAACLRRAAAALDRTDVRDVPVRRHLHSALHDRERERVLALVAMPEVGARALCETKQPESLQLASLLDKTKQ